MQPVEALLDVAAYPDQEISVISFNFWHRLMRHLMTGFSEPGEVRKHCRDPEYTADWHTVISADAEKL